MTDQWWSERTELSTEYEELDELLTDDFSLYSARVMDALIKRILRELMDLKERVINAPEEDEES